MAEPQETEAQKKRADDLRKQIAEMKNRKPGTPPPRPLSPRDAIEEKMRELDRKEKDTPAGEGE